MGSGKITVEDGCPGVVMHNGALFTKDLLVLFRVPVKLEGEFVVPDETKIIGENAFDYTSLSRIVLGSGVEEIHECAFAWSDSLETLIVKSENIKIDGGILRSCDNVTVLAARRSTMHEYCKMNRIKCKKA